MPGKYGKKISTDFVKIGDPESEEAKDSEYDYRIFVAGVLMESGRKNMSGGQVGSYKIEQEDGSVVTFLGSVILDDLLSLIEIGTDLYVKYDGLKKSTQAGHSPTKQYVVFTAD